jgi:hypothetical protein
MNTGMRALAPALFAASVALTGCRPAVVLSELRTGLPRPGRPPTCALEVIPSASSSDREPAGTVQLRIGRDLDPLSEEVRAVMRPRACAMGGDAVTVLVSQRGYVVFQVWAPRATAPAAPQRF